MNYKCNSCTKQFKPVNQFDTNCVHCGSDDVSMDESTWNFEKVIRFVTKSPNKYILLGIVLVIILLRMCSPNLTNSENIEYKLVGTKYPDYVQFSILQLVKDGEGNTVGQKDPIKGKNVQDFLGGIFRIDDSGKNIKLNLVGGDKYYACVIPQNQWTFIIDPKGSYKNKISTHTVTWMPSKVNCPSEPQEAPTLTHVTAKQVGSKLLIGTNLDGIKNHAPLFYSISGKDGDFIESKTTWEICDMSEVDVWVTDEVDTVLAAGASPIVIDKSVCPMTAQQLAKLVTSIQVAGNTLGSNMTDPNLLSNFENAFSVMIDSDGNGTEDKRLGASPMNIEFQIDSQKFHYLGFQSYTFSLIPPVRRYRCSVVLTNGRISKVIFQ
jgi:hypothetical protein